MYRSPIRQLAIAILNSEDGISSEAYELLLPFIANDTDITACVEATDGCFYLPSGWTDDTNGRHTKGYLFDQLRAICPNVDLVPDNGGQLVAYTGLMENEAGILVDFEG